ncbi:bacteriocin fulvocin C-related protein [Flavobacterium salilacus subsp. salilacus]|uniref:bacteriocin fulvocin C-related protein n=1 Tax=Flavobacterium TaxID=237 RepID=UPI001074E33C|nr:MULTISPECIES: bacteriocin fulvocin C-related protein [Flavobacterium]KAF2519000.1 bacteriocin fulvocin C-related protein [Flavobacterium salilacus subsp. salilacus]MBE1614837.1 bacteriocin fulvocin C-related protein [Flavobacterium sp. SaA2.13]
MKKFLFVAFSATVFLVGCSKDDNSNSQNADALKVESVLNIRENPNFQTKSDTTDLEDAERTAYLLLNASEKLVYWQTKLSDFIVEDRELSTAEINLIEEVKAAIDVDVFEDITNDKQEYFKNIFVPDFLDRVDDVMPTSKVENLFYGYTPSLGSAKKKCNCNQGSMFGCGASNHCDERVCKKKSRGCGFMFLWECNGICSYTDF